MLQWLWKHLLACQHFSPVSQLLHHTLPSQSLVCRGAMDKNWIKLRCRCLQKRGGRQRGAGLSFSPQSEWDTHAHVVRPSSVRDHQERRKLRRNPLWAAHEVTWSLFSAHLEGKGSRAKHPSSFISLRAQVEDQGVVVQMRTCFHSLVRS